ncbi:MAG: hypothetical protein M1840_004829 [Geoglossum simile]|nr:MAG: hypothetical protein M1840_004829 [Geoglossum simile]
MEQRNLLREFYLIALTQGDTPQTCASGDSTTRCQNSCCKATRPSTAGRDEHGGSQRDLPAPIDDQAQSTESTSPRCEEASPVESPHSLAKLSAADQYSDPCLPDDPTTRDTHGGGDCGESIGSGGHPNEAKILQHGPGHTTPDGENSNADTRCAELSLSICDRKSEPSPLPHIRPLLVDLQHPNASHNPIATLESDADPEPSKPPHIGGSITKELSTLRELQSAWEDSACQHCRLLGLVCDRARPSCWVCQQKFLQCCYGSGVQDQNYQSLEGPLELGLEPLSWLDARRENTYYNLKGEGKESRVETRYLKPHRAKPRPSKKTAAYAEDAVNGEEREALLRAFSPGVFGGEGYPALIETEAQTASPASTPPVSPWRRYSNSTPQQGDELTIPLVFAESVPSTPSLRSRSERDTTPPTSGGSGSQAPVGEGRSNDSLKPFQCTFCLKRCGDQEEWEQHENSQHIPQEEWICMPWGPIEESDGHDTCVFCGAVDIDTKHCSIHNDQPCYSRETRHRTYTNKSDFRNHLRKAHNQPTLSRCMEDWWWAPEDSSWYWNCGFCGEVLTRWSDRTEHIGSHFQRGETMSSWDPLMPPSPIDRYILDRISGSLPLGWDSGTLSALQREQPDRTKRAQVVEEDHRCELCGVFCRDGADAQRHKHIWHSSREIWLCPTMSDIQSGPLAAYFFPIDQPAKDAACPLCAVLFADLAQLYPGLDDWAARAKHLEVDHDVGACQAARKFLRSGDILLHLANIHSVSLSDYTGRVIDSCKRAERLLAETADSPPTASADPTAKANTRPAT